MLGFRRKRRVLLLDDDPSMQRLVTKILKRAGFRVDVFLTGRDAMKAMEGKPYDVLLLDLMMPHEGGITVIRHLQSKAPHMLRNAIVLTGSSESVIDTIKNQVAAVVQKPFEASHLVDVVRRIAGT